jgi:hypothetical protein
MNSVQACMLESLLRILKEECAAGNDITKELMFLFDEPLNPVSKIAQRKVLSICIFLIKNSIHIKHHSTYPKEFEYLKTTQNSFSKN